MNLATRLAPLMTPCLCSLALAQATLPLDTAAIDAQLGRPGAWVEGIYLTTFPRPDLAVRLDGVRLSTAHVVSFITFSGAGGDADVMGEICALPSEVTHAVAGMRAGGLEVTGVHNHFMGEAPRLTFIHFIAHGPAPKLARAFRAALVATTTPLGKPPAAAEPAWAAAMQHAMGRPGTWLAPDHTLEVDVLSADFAPGPMDFWYESPLFFQETPSGKIAATGDVMVTARELNPVLSALLAHHFRIEGVHNHVINEEPRVFFVHYWKIDTPRDLADGLNAALAAIHTRD